MRYLVAGLLLAVACSGDDGTAELVVFAASSLEGAMEELAAGFEQDHPRADVVVSLAGSQTLATQIENGARPDVFASADPEQMDRAAAARPPDRGPTPFASNRLVIVVEQGNPHRVEGLEDLAREDLVVTLGAEEVPVGAYSSRVLDAAGVVPNVASFEPNVGLVLAKVTLGEADAAVVYRSDLVRTEAAVEGVEIPAASNVTATYPIAAWGDGLAGQFVDHVLSTEGKEALRAAGFGT